MLLVLLNAALAFTSVASATILLSTAGLFILNLAKVVAVFVSITGVAIATLGRSCNTATAKTLSKL